MPVVEVSLVVPVEPLIAFAVSQTSGEVRRRWDSFIREQRHIDGATRAAKGVRTLTISRGGLRMVSEYVSFRPPTSVGMRVLELPWFLEKVGGGWRFEPADGGTRAIWRYNFGCRPAAIRSIAERIGTVLIRRDMRRRIRGFARGCSDPAVLAAARTLAAEW